ncbi:MAG: hypothetical protein ACREUX_00285 [Burkholderiales bacterium]
MRAVEILRKSAEAEVAPAAFVNGYTDGQTARRESQALTAYLRVGIDDYAKGFRAGFFARALPGVIAELPVRRQVVNL